MTKEAMLVEALRAQLKEMHEKPTVSAEARADMLVAAIVDQANEHGEAYLSQCSDGWAFGPWVDHVGGKQPAELGEDDVVCIKMIDGEHNIRTAGRFFWSKDGGASDICKWRRVTFGNESVKWVR
jgi:hypothetical protein